MRALLAMVTVVLLSTAALGQDYPNRPIRFVTFGAAGSASDVLVRTIGKRLSEKLGQPVIVDNKPGADGIIAGNDVAKSTPDGHTLFFASNSPIAAAPALRKSVPYDPVKDFTPITMVGYYTFFLYAHPDVPAKTLGELIAYAKANPGKLSYGSGNTTGSVGASQIATVTTLQERYPGLPDVPTIHEAGLPQYTITSWGGMFGPANMPKEIVARLNKEFLEILKEPEVIEALGKQGFVLTPSTPEALGKFLGEQIEAWKVSARAAGIEPE